jgi:alpha-tubulin suppressor-like RCC1 family protein
MAILSTFGAMTARGFGWLSTLAASGTGLYAWGYSLYGQLGLGNTVNRSSPVQVGALTTWTKVAGGSLHTMALKSDGTLWGWGYGSEGSLGTGTTVSYSSPVQIGALTTWSKLHPHLYTTHVIKTDGTLWGWGQGYYGMVGVGNTTSYSSPVQIGTLGWDSGPTGGMGFKTVAIRNTGTLWAWGWKTAHDGSAATGGSDSPSYYSNVVGTPIGGVQTGDASSPVQIGGAISTTWARTASGNLHSLAITPSGALYAWGSHAIGQLGVGTVNNNPAYYYPQPDYAGGSLGFCLGPNFSQYETDASSPVDGVMALDSTGTVCSPAFVVWTYVSPNTHMWGYSSPVQVGALTTWSKVAAGNFHSLAIKTDGTLWSWGRNSEAQLGLGDTSARSSPVQVGALATWAMVSGGGSFSLAVKTDGTLWAWGENSYGQLGLGNQSQISSPVQVGTKTNWLSTGFSAGEYHTLAIRS